MAFQSLLLLLNHTSTTTTVSTFGRGVQRTKVTCLPKVRTSFRSIVGSEIPNRDDNKNNYHTFRTRQQLQRQQSCWFSTTIRTRTVTGAKPKISTQAKEGDGKKKDNRRWKSRQKRSKKISPTTQKDQQSNTISNNGIVLSTPPKKVYNGPFPSKNTNLEVSITCLPGLESILSMELERLNLQHKVVPSSALSGGSGDGNDSGSGNGVVTLTSPNITVQDIFSCALYLGTASRILIKCCGGTNDGGGGDSKGKGKNTNTNKTTNTNTNTKDASFSARGLAELRRKVSLFPWENIFHSEICLDARIFTTKSKLYHTEAIKDRVIAGIYEALGYNNIPVDYNHKTHTNPAIAVAEAVAEEKAAAAAARIKQDGNDKNKNKNQMNKKKDSTPLPTVLLDVRIVRDQVEIFLNASPTPLHQRGYRLETAKAPLREDLAYAMLWTSGWMSNHNKKKKNDNNKDDEFDHHPRQTTLLDPFCGSGTIAIEAASARAGLPPGRLRPAPLQGTRLVENNNNNDGNLLLSWTQLVNSASSPSSLLSPLQFDYPVAASDRDAGAINACKANAKRAGVSNFMNIQQMAVSAHPWLEKTASNHPTSKRPSDGNDNKSNNSNNNNKEKMTTKANNNIPKSLLLVTNPPFGERISKQRGTKNNNDDDDDQQHLLPLYQRLNDRLTSLKKDGHHVGVVLLSNNPSFVKKSGLSLKKGFKSIHGGMAVYAMVSDVD